MSDWNVGDLALCVDAKSRPHITALACSLIDGAAYRISGEAISNKGFPCLLVEGHGATKFYADRFRKIRPDEQEACEPEFRTLLRRFRQTERA